MLLGSQFPNTASASHAGNFTRLSANYNELFDLRAGKPCLFTQTTAGSQTLTITRNLTSDAALDFNTLDYPYLVAGILGCGNADFDGQLFPSCQFTVNGKWGGHPKIVQAQLGPSGLSTAFVVFKRSEKSGATPTTQVQVAMTANFITAAANFGVGEFFICGADEIPIVSNGGQLNNVNTIPRASNSTPAFVLRDALRSFSIQTGPLTLGDANGTPSQASASLAGVVSKDMSRNFMDAMYAAIRNGACFVATEWRNPGTNGPDNPTINRNGMLANLANPNPSYSKKTASGNTFYAGTAGFLELA